MKKRLTNNFSMKIISLLLAIVFWLVVVTIEDPEGTRTIELPVTKVNEELIRENDKTYEVIEGNTVTITVRARESVLKDLSAKDFSAVADFANLSFTGAVPIEITTLHNSSQVTITKGANAMMQVSIEDLATVDKMIATKAEGSVITGKALGSVTVEPNMIRIEGAKTTIDRISSVYAVVNVSGISADTSFVVDPVLYDSNGDIIDATDVTFSETSLKVDVSLLDTKSVPIKWNIKAFAAEGYGIESQDYTPAEILIAGTEDTLADINEIVLEDYVAEGLTESVEAEVEIDDIVRSMGASLVNLDTDRVVKLAVKVAPYSHRTGTVDFSTVQLNGKSEDYNYNIVGESAISYSVSGLDSALEILDYTKLQFSLDVTDLTEGTHTLTLNMETTQQVELDSAPTVKVRISSK